MNEKILLNKSKSKVSTNVNNSLTIQLKGSKRMLPCEPLQTTVSEIDVYNEERENCSKIRLTVEINPICSNVLFNNITEIVKNEGTDDTIWVNYGKEYMTDLDDLVLNKTFFFKKVNGEDGFYTGTGSGNLNSVNAIRDTQLSSIANGYKYHCGLDIFNNHLLRSKTFKTVCPLESGENKHFNTLFDEMRNYNGVKMKGFKDKDNASNNPDLNLHLYLAEEISSFKETVSEKLVEKNGWFGFTNVGKLKVYDDKHNNNYDWFKVINYRKPCDFIDMYPNRELFFFDPIYNSYRQRIEKNWLYCITYPSSSTTEVSFIKTYSNNTTGLKVMLFDDTIKHKNGIDAIKIWSVSKHGLSKDNIINLYRGEECVLKKTRVFEVVDDYVFYVYRDGVKVSNKWLELPTHLESTYEGYNVSSDRKYLSKDGVRYYTINHEKVNVDDAAQDISFKRVVNDEETSYYVRIFSKLPNWKFANEKPTEKLLYKDNKDYIKTYQKYEYDFDSHIGKLAFSKNIYTDNISEIVFTDDIDISELKDNLGRPLSEIYLTIIKNNCGYREWYGKNPLSGCITSDIDDLKVEYSHCFGKLNCAFKLSKESIPNGEHKNVLMINNIDNIYDKNGLDITFINNRTNESLDDDEIQYEPYKTNTGDSNFYGDLCCYSEALCEEQSIQMVDFRFNTMQRELTNSFLASYFISDIIYDEIISDDYDDNGFLYKDDNKFTKASTRKEGYYYKPHYKIQIKTYDKNITTVYPRFLSVKRLESISSNLYTIVTLDRHYLGVDDVIHIYEKKHKIYYYAKVISVINNRSVNINIYEDELLEKPIDVNVNNKKEMKFFLKVDNIPSYSHLLKDGSCRYVYRELHQNGYDDNTDIETYPFTNGNLYVNKNIVFFLRRQNPNGETDLRSKTYPYDIVNNTISFTKENKYYHEENMQC